MSFLKNIVKKIFNKKSTTTFNIDDTWDQSSYSTDNKKNSQCSLLTIEEENQSFEIEVFETVYS